MKYGSQPLNLLSYSIDASSQRCLDVTKQEEGGGLRKHYFLYSCLGFSPHLFLKQVALKAKKHTENSKTTKIII